MEIKSKVHLEMDNLSKINEICLPYMKKPRRIIGAKAIVLEDLRNNAGDVIKAGEIVEIYQSFRGYGIKTTNELGRKIYITRVSHYDVRFLKVEV